jgi:hypothetical protein
VTVPSIACCDRCQFVVRIPTGHRLPAHWERDMYLGQDLCARCVERVARERASEKWMGTVGDG